MKLIVGLGNPGKQYADTRHNVGFMLLEECQRVFGLPAWTNKCKGLLTKGRMAGHDTVLLMPQTFMNLSGESVHAACTFYKILPEDVLVVHDELDVPLCQLKYKLGGGDAGHNGLKSITHLLGTPNYGRLRFGIGRPVHKSQVSDYVLSPFNPGEALEVTETIAWLIENMPGLFEHPQPTLAKRKAAL